MVASARPFTARAEQAAQQLLRSISDAHPEIAGILVVSADNRPLSNEIQPITRDPLTDESWYRIAVDKPGTVQLLPRPIGRNLKSIHEYRSDEVVSIVKAVEEPDSNTVRGVVLIDLRLQVMEAIFDDMTVGVGGFLFIEAPGGAIVYTPVNPIVYRVRDEWLDTPRASSVRRSKGADYQIVSQGSAYTQWKTGGVFPLSELMSQVSTIRSVVESGSGRRPNARSAPATSRVTRPAARTATTASTASRATSTTPRRGCAMRTARASPYR